MDYDIHTYVINYVYKMIKFLFLYCGAGKAVQLNFRMILPHCCHKKLLAYLLPSPKASKHTNGP